MKLSRLAFISAIVLVLLPLLSGQEPDATKPVGTAVAPEHAQEATENTYVIGESDVLSINVWHEPDLTRVVPVRTDGKITLPLIGELQASGMTVEQLRSTIATKLKSVLEAPEVTVIVQEARSQYFTLVGKVMKPGSYPLAQRLTVLDGIALGGGFKDFAKQSKIYVVRKYRDGRTEKLPFDYKKAIDGDLKLNFPLEARDMIVVP
ncbi:MAG TPA: polysaccharide biosynthesis/export family protein [candidate division Zixibacteria bacterium]|nr:polysaccharide biosynthesis/export family protein [candidate division Zixibacteria bacterium]